MELIFGRLRQHHDRPKLGSVAGVPYIGYGVDRLYNVLQQSRAGLHSDEAN